MKHKIEFYQRENDTIPVLEFMKSLDKKMMAKAYHEIELLEQFGSTLREPHVKPIKGHKNKGLYELRIKHSSDISRIFFFCYKNDKFVLLHGFVKKTAKIPKREIERAKANKDDYERRCDDGQS